MAATTGPRNGIKYAWALGETGWNTDMDANLKLLDRVGPHLSIKDRDLATPPGSPANGDTYIVAASPTGDWSGHAGEIAYYSTEGTPGWVFYTPRNGYLAVIEDEAKLSAFLSGAWSAGVAI
jgi:hypothetical protein